MFAKLSIAALFAGLAAAYHAPVGEPSGNPITRPLNEIVPAGKPFEITWTPTTSNPVSLVLLKGPAINVIPQYAIVEAIPNSGRFTWTPDVALEGTTTPTGYGIQIIDDVTGQYQYSTQFGIASSGKASNTPSAAPATTPAAPATTPAKPAHDPLNLSGYTPVTSIPKPKPTTPAYATGKSSSTFCTTTTAYAPVPTGAHHNGTVVQPSKPITIPSSLKPSASGPYAPGNTTAQFQGAASGLQVGAGFAGLAAGLVLLW